MSENIVLLTFDSLRADHCGFMGYDRDTTPNLDRLAEDGLVFENAVASGVPTITSMTAVMTGQHSDTSPEIGFSSEQREQIASRPTLAEELSRAGYHTGALSPNPPASSYFGFDQGFDWFEDYLAGDRGVIERAWNRVFQRSIQGGAVSTYIRLVRNVIKREEVLRPWEDYYEDIISWCRRTEEPYFLWVLLLDPHHPWLPPTGYQRWSTRADKYRSFKHYWEMLNGGWEPDFDPDVRRRILGLYDDSIRYADAFVGRLLDDLGDDDPVVVIHADHGEEFGAHGRYGHQPYLTEALIHVPLLIAGAGRSGRVTRPVSLRQIAPTICDIADVEHPFVAPSLLSEARHPWVESQVLAEDDPRVAIRTEGLKFTRRGRPEGGELYDLSTDPDEQRDLTPVAPHAAELLERCAVQHEVQEAEKRLIRDRAASVDLMDRTEDRA